MLILYKSHLPGLQINVAKGRRKTKRKMWIDDYPAHLAEIQKREGQPRKLKIAVCLINQGCGTFLRPSIIPSPSSNKLPKSGTNVIILCIR